MRVHIGTDHAAFELKAYLVEHLRAEGFDVIDHGAHEFDPSDDYPDFIIPTAEAVLADEGSLGIVLGGSGNGEQMSANKVAGIRAALVWNESTALLARQHNDANVLVMPGRFIGTEEADMIMTEFFNTSFEGGRHQRRIDKIPVQG